MGERTGSPQEGDPLSLYRPGSLERLALTLNERANRSLPAAGRQVDFTYEIYPGVGHSFVRICGPGPGHETPQSAFDAWERGAQLPTPPDCRLAS
jgi:acetyl esterase/lipase